MTVAITGEWAQLTSMPQTSVAEDIAWVHRSDLERRWLEVEQGVFDIVDSPDEPTRYRVRSLTPGTGLDDRGVQIGDELLTEQDICCSDVLPSTLWVVREGVRVPLSR